MRGSSTGRLRRRRRLKAVAVCTLAVTLPACARALPPVTPPQPAVIQRPAEADTAILPLGEPLPAPPRRVADAPAVLAIFEGEATYYASSLVGNLTASGIPFSNDEPWAAHREWPFGTRARVTNLANGRKAEVIIVDRGPFGEVARRRNTIIDVSQSIARALDFMRAGRTPVLVEVLEWGDG